MLKSILLVGAGSCIGGIARYLLMLYIKTPSSGFPVAVLTVNLTGCFLIGLLYGLFLKFFPDNNDLLFFLTTGICGGFTTFSTFANESFQLLNTQNLGYLFLYVTCSVIFGIFLVWAGYGLVNLITHN